MAKTRRTSTIHDDPAPAPSQDTLPHPVTFFLRDGERREVLSRLQRISCNRTQALLKALGVPQPEGDAHE